MSLPPFSWMFKDPAEIIDDIRGIRKRLEEAEKKRKAQELKANRRKIRKLLKAAKRRELKGQK